MRFLVLVLIFIMLFFFYYYSMFRHSLCMFIKKIAYQKQVPNNKRENLTTKYRIPREMAKEKIIGSREKKNRRTKETARNIIGTGGWWIRCTCYENNREPFFIQFRLWLKVHQFSSCFRLHFVVCFIVKILPILLLSFLCVYECCLCFLKKKWIIASNVLYVYALYIYNLCGNFIITFSYSFFFLSSVMLFLGILLYRVFHENTTKYKEKMKEFIFFKFGERRKLLWSSGNFNFP